MNYLHKAIFKLHPNVVTIVDATAYDANNKIVSYDTKAVNSLESLLKAEANRKAAYIAEADPLFFKWQAGEGTQEEWQAKRAEIKDRYPYPSDPINVNTATKDELRSLSGVDAVRAQAIIDGRPWSSVDDLATIQGISSDMIAGWDITV